MEKGNKKKSDISFLADDPIRTESEDKFGHSVLAKRLLAYIEATPGRFNIGLFGKWGVGKTGILRLLEERLRSEPLRKRYDYLYVDAWQLSTESLRQQLLFSISQKYDPGKTEEQIIDELFHTKEVTITEKEEETFIQKLKRLGNESLPYLVIMALIGAIGGFLHAWTTNPTVLPTTITLLVSALLIPLIKRLAEISRAVSRSAKRIIPRVESPFVFRRMFEELLKKKDPKKKLVIALDNLDRCEEDLVVEMLGTIKTFMEHDDVVYVIACDDKALEEHLSRQRHFLEDNARDFLRKFFQVSMTIPPFIAGDIEDYADSLVAQLGNPEFINEPVKEVLVQASIDNPRRVKRFLNTLVAEYHIAREKEQRGDIRAGVITGHTGFLAKKIVLQDLYPKFYEKLSKQDDLLRLLERYFRGEMVPDLPEKMVKGIFEESHGLRDFLLRTRLIETDNVSAFINLREERYEVTLAEVDQLRLAARAGDSTKLLQIFKRFDETGQLNAIRTLLKMLGQYSQRGRYQHLHNVLRVLLETFPNLPEGSKPEILREVQVYLSSPEVVPNLMQFPVADVFRFLRQIETRYRDTILTSYAAGLLRNAVLDVRLLDHLISTRDLLPPSAIREINKSLASFYQKNEQECQTVLETKILIEDELQRLLLRDEMPSAIASSILPDKPLNQTRERVNLYMKVRQHASSSTKVNFIRRILALFPKQPASSFDQNMKFILDTLSALEEADVPQIVVPELSETLQRYMQPIGDEGQRLKFLQPIIKHLEKLPENSREQFLKTHVRNRLSSGQPPIVLSLIEYFSESTYQLMDDDASFNSLLARSQKDILDAKLMNFLIKQSTNQQKEKVVEAMIANINSGNEARQNAALSSFKDNCGDLSKSLASRIFQTSLQVTKGMPPEKKTRFFDSLVECLSSYTAESKKQLRNEILELMRDSNANIQSKGFEYFRKIKTELTLVQRKHILRQLIIGLPTKLNASARKVLDIVFENKDDLDEEDFLRLIDYLTGHISTAVTPEARLLALEYTLRLDNLYRRATEVLQAVLDVYSTGEPKVQETGKQILSKFKRYKVRNGFWEEVEKIVGKF